MVPLALVLGVVSAVMAGRPLDHSISIFSLAIISLPEFIIGSLLILVFFSWLDVLPPVSLIPPGTSPLATPEALVLPMLTLLGASLAASIRMVRAGMIETLNSEYVTMARLNGLREGVVVRRYALRNALAPSVQVFAQNIDRGGRVPGPGENVILSWPPDSTFVVDDEHIAAEEDAA